MSLLPSPYSWLFAQEPLSIKGPNRSKEANDMLSSEQNIVDLGLDFLRAYPLPMHIPLQILAARPAAFLYLFWNYIHHQPRPTSAPKISIRLMRQKM